MRASVGTREKGPEPHEGPPKAPRWPGGSGPLGAPASGPLGAPGAPQVPSGSTGGPVRLGALRAPGALELTMEAMGTPRAPVASKGPRDFGGTGGPPGARWKGPRPRGPQCGSPRDPRGPHDQTLLQNCNARTIMSGPVFDVADGLGYRAFLHAN